MNAEDGGATTQGSAVPAAAEHVVLRPARPGDVADIARVWESGWREAHLGQVPRALVDARPPDSWRPRAERMLGSTIVAAAGPTVVGFVTVRGHEVEQLYVEPTHRGTGTAARLLRAAERAIAATGARSAWLAVVPGNRRARRFYERLGWRDDGDVDHRAPGARPGDEPITVRCRRYVRDLAPPGDDVRNA